MARRLIDCQYFPQEDIGIIHEIVDGKRNYQIFKNPDFHYYIEPELKKLKKETEYYKDISKLKRIDCKFIDRYKSIADVTDTIIENPNKIYYQDQQMLMANHNLYSADDQIETRLIIDYCKKYKDEIDETIPVNYLFFDIEVHSDFDKKAYYELEKIMESIENPKYKYEPELNGIRLEHFRYLMEETDMDKVKQYIQDFYIKSNDLKYMDIRFYVALFNSKAKEIDYERVSSFLKAQLTKEKMEFIYENLGFPDENKGNNRIDAISFVDVTKRKLYMYLLNVEEDLEKIDEKEYIKNISLVENDLFNFIELFSITSYLKNIDKANKEVCKPLLDELDFLNDVYHNIDIKAEYKDKVESLVKLARGLIPNYESEVKVNIEYKIFDKEIDMILDFFNKIKNEIQPSVMAAHNARFDILTIKNRLEKHGYDFDKIVNQFSDEEDQELQGLKTRIKIDLETMERKKEKTKYMFPGIVMLDTLLMYAKSVSGEKSWALDYIVKDELNDSKIGYDFEIHEFYFKDIKRFIKYSAVDTLLLMRLEEKLKFIALFQLILSSTKTGWEYVVYRSMYLTNMLKYDLLESPNGTFVLRNNLTFLNPEKTSKETYAGAYNTDLSGAPDSYGLYENLFDLDFSAFYPNCALTTNLCVDQLIFTTDDKEKHNDYIFMSKIGFGNKYLNLPNADEIFDEL